MPLIIAHLWNLPTPFSGSEDVDITVGEISPQEQNQTAISDENSKMVSVHFCKNKLPQLYKRNTIKFLPIDNWMLTVIIGRANYVFLYVFLLIRNVFVLQPGGYSENRRQVVVQHVCRNGNSSVSSVKLENFVAFPTFISWQGLCPLGAQSWRGQKIYAVFACSTQLPLALYGVCVPVAAFADM